jgi:hypothetical protein
MQSCWRHIPPTDEVTSVVPLHGGRAEDGPWYTLSREKVRYTKKEEDRRRATVNLNGPLSWELVL